MRALRMSKRSVYHGIRCQHCHKTVTIGRSFLGTTLYVTPGKSWVRTQAKPSLEGLSVFFTNHDDLVREVEIRIVYHRACIEKILQHGPLDPEIEIALFETYRDGLLERYQ